ncbi:MAG: efflux RND transporter permease subunit, partial [Bacteroidales bacterium]|nr:efflux RND transporter permease subunit [Bacteroidales bacterium]
ANAISRENVERKIVVSANVAGRDLQGAVDEIEKTIREKTVLPEGYHITYGGQFESARSASRTLLLASLAALLLVFMLLYVEFKEVPLSAMVLLNLPLALIGGIAAIYLTSGIVSIPSIIGFITLFGIATRNGILLISRYRHLQAEENLPLRDLIRKGSEDRLNPILMTALTSALALVPLVLNGDLSGNEIQSPMAVVVLGGLLTSTLLNIYVIPVVYEWFRKRKKSTQTISGGFKNTLATMGVLLSLAALPALSPAWAQSAKSVNPTVATVAVTGLSDVSTQKIDKKDTAALSLQGNPVDEPKSYADIKELMADLEYVSPALQALRSAADAEKYSYKTGLTPGDPEVGFSYKWGTRGAGDEAELEVVQAFEFPAVYAYAKKLSDLNVRNADLRYERARLAWQVEVRQLCIRVVYYNAMEKLWRRRMEQADTLLDAYQKTFRMGETNSLDMNKARMNWVKLRNEYQNLLIDRESLEMELSRLMGGAPVRLLQSDYDPMEWPADFDRWYGQMSIWHPALMLSEGEADAAKKGVELNTAHAFPSFKVGYKGENIFNEG